MRMNLQLPSMANPPRKKPLFACIHHNLVVTIAIEKSHSRKEGSDLRNENLVKDDGEVSLKHKLTGHQREVSIVSWSPDDQQLLTCGVEESIRRWMSILGYFSGMTDKSICLWDLDGRELECWKGQRTLKISDIAITDDGKRIITMCRENAILLLDREAKCERLIRENQMITSFSLSKTTSSCWGHKRTRFLIRSCFGGLEQAFIASGSEDSKVYVWHRDTPEPLFALPGHSGAVNCVSWSPTNPHMLASGSDDYTIRIWGLDQVKLKNRDNQRMASTTTQKGKPETIT
ncbi:WD repeat-containing protein 26-like [Vitis vinifera]|uniref:WD repeat-containing protein 26-like n=1 Tax=Vitis vinifera TaxID=29760 RepID=A0A438K4V0_VITVI|nr:WD repeat-containing protein 26-like [Vitis vinifera]